MAARHTVTRTITVITTTWTIRWWNGEIWVAETLEPTITVVLGGEATGSVGEPAPDAAPMSQEPSCEFETNQQHKHKERKP
jgi:hypothetical protein